jgi:hypothetical protein
MALPGLALVIARACGQPVAMHHQPVMRLCAGLIKVKGGPGMGASVAA